MFCVYSSPFLPDPTIWLHLDNYLRTNNDQVDRLLKSTYVDDVIIGEEVEEEAFEPYVQSKPIFREGGFNLRKFLTNSRYLQKLIDFRETRCTSSLSQNELTYSETRLRASHSSRTEENEVPVVSWNPVSDQFCFSASSKAQLALDLSPTKRNLVSLTDIFMTHFGFFHLSLYASRSSFRSNVSAGSTGTKLFH